MATDTRASPMSACQTAFIDKIKTKYLKTKSINHQDLFKALRHNGIYDPPDTLHASPGDVEAYCLKRVYVWIPHIYGLNQFPISTWTCPKCNLLGKMKNDKWHPTINKIYDVDNVAYVLSYDYKCSNCGSNTKGTEEALLPPALKNGKTVFISAYYQSKYLASHE